MIEHSGKNNKEKRETILVVEDDPFMAQLLDECLQLVGYTVVFATDGRNGLNKYKEVKPDLVVTDLRMPGIGGIELLSRIKEEDPSMLVMIITGYPTTESKIETLKLGAVEYLTKPFGIAEIRKKIQDIFSKDHQELENNRLKDLVSLLCEKNERLEEEVKPLSEKIEGKTKGKDKYRSICGSVAHSLKGEFMHIDNSIKNLRELAGNSLDIQDEYDMIERSIQYSQLLLRRLLDYLDMGKPRVESLDAQELLRRTEQLVRPRLPSSIQLNIKVDQSMKKQIVSANIEQLMGVLLELIQNAVNVLREKGGTIELELMGRSDKIAISVRDNGPGIPKKLKKKLFKKQVTSKSGLGLGLFLCNKVISEMGGKLDLKTSSEEGTIFTVLLPKVSDNKES